MVCLSKNALPLSCQVCTRKLTRHVVPYPVTAHSCRGVTSVLVVLTCISSLLPSSVQVEVVNFTGPLTESAFGFISSLFFYILSHDFFLLCYFLYSAYFGYNFLLSFLFHNVEAEVIHLRPFSFSNVGL